MIFHDFNELREATLQKGEPVPCGIVMPDDGHTLEAVNAAANAGLIAPVLIRDRSPEEAMRKAVSMVHSGEIRALMKGMLQTADFMKALVKRENGLKTGSLISMLSIRKLPNYHKLIAMTDTGICEAPTLEQKRELIKNAVTALTAMGLDKPKVAALAAAETVNQRMQSSADAAALKETWLQGDIDGCIVEGPISVDLALSGEAAAIKRYDSPVAGDADLLLFPDLVSANITGKLLAIVTGSPAGILILGTKVPVVVCSRSASVETKFLSIMLAASNGVNTHASPETGALCASVRSVP